MREKGILQKAGASNITLFTVIYARATFAQIYCCVPVNGLCVLGARAVFRTTVEPGNLFLRNKDLLGRRLAALSG